MIETFYDTDGNPISLEVYLALTEDGTEQTIKEDKLDNGLIVRTIWVGMNLQPEPDGPLQIIETVCINRVTEIGSRMCYHNINTLDSLKFFFN